MKPMNRFKSIFIGVYPVVAMGIIVYSGWYLYETRDVVAWAGPLLTAVPFVTFLTWVLLVQNVARTSGSFPGLNIIALAGVALAGYAAFFRQTQTSPIPFGLALLGAATFALYSLWYSRLGRKPSSKIVVGQALPDVELHTSEGKTFHTSDLRGRPALIFFYRGNWCPLCMAQIKEVARHYQQIVDAGARIVLISPQPHSNTISLAKRFNVSFDFVVDTGNRIARALDIEMKSGLPLGMGLLGYESDTVYPTVIVLDRDGIVRWLDQTDNYRIRPEPETFLPFLRDLGTAAQR